ncbi:MAG: hypothetical protein ACI867_002523 [Glaciecola sp.]|jgi:uncharacterized protein YxjI
MAQGPEQHDEIDPQGPKPPAVPTTRDTPERIRRQIETSGAVADGQAGTGNLLDERLLVVNQKAKLLEINNEYAIFDQQGAQVGAIRQVGQGWFRKAVRLLTDFDQYLTHRLEVVDAQGDVLFKVTRPAKFIKSKMLVESPQGQPLGQLVQQNAIGKIRFDMISQGQSIGSLNAENWRAWDFAILDAAGTEVARITKTWEGLAKTMFTSADNYVVKVHRPLTEPLRTLVMASAVTVDTALKQDSRGLN